MEATTFIAESNGIKRMSLELFVPYLLNLKTCYKIDELFVCLEKWELMYPLYESLGLERRSLENLTDICLTKSKNVICLRVSDSKGYSIDYYSNGKFICNLTLPDYIKKP
jgi:hypothetical protein